MSTPTGDPKPVPVGAGAPGLEALVLAPTAYGEQLLLVLAAASAYRPGLWSADERMLLGRLRAAPGAVRQVIGRLAQRRSGRLPRSALEPCDEQVLAALSDSAWCLVDDEAIHLSPGAAAFVTAAVLVVFGDDRQDLSFFPRLALGRLQLPPGSRCRDQLQALLQGVMPPAAHGGAPAALATRAGLDAYLVARTARAQRLQPLGRGVAAVFARAYAETTARAGEPWPLMGAHLDATRHWSALLWAARGCVAADDPRRRLALRALRRAPLAPRAACRLWEEVWRAAQARSGRMISAHVASFALWTPGERSRWRERGRQPGQPRAVRSRWRVLTVRAWLERDGQGLVVAQGEGVEAHALRRLAQDGWQGVHAEGELWVALATLLYWDQIMAPVAGVWVAPLQRWPLDWQRWGFVHRRREIVSQATAALIRSPQECLARAYALLGEGRIPGWFTPPPRAAAEAIVTLMPPATLGRLLKRVLADPRSASGLPDLIAWRGRELVLWEVKSPKDALSDRQVSWLTWLISEDVAAGELRVDERQPTQGSLFATPVTPSAARRSSRPSAHAKPLLAARRTVSERSAVVAIAGRDWSFSLAAGAELPEQLHDHGPGGVALGSQPVLPVESWNGRLGDGAVTGWDRPVMGLLPIPALAVLVVRTRRTRVLTRRWYPLPAGCVLAALLVHEALREGGIGLRAVLLERRSGFLVPADAALREPVCVPGAEMGRDAQETQPVVVSRRHWSVAPNLEPFRPERLAEAWGCAADLQAQLALLGSCAYCLSLGAEPGTLVVSVAATAPVLWTMTARQLAHGTLQRGLAGYVH